MYCQPTPSSLAAAQPCSPVATLPATIDALQCPAIQAHDGISNAIARALEALSLVAVESRLCHGRLGVMNPRPDRAKTKQIVDEALDWLKRHHALSQYLNGSEIKSTERIYAAATINTRFLLAHPEVNNTVPVASALYASLVLASIEMTHPGLKHHFQPLRFIQPKAGGQPDEIYDVVLYNTLRHLDALEYAALADATDHRLDTLTIRVESLASLAALLHACKSEIAIINPSCTDKIISFESSPSVGDTWNTLAHMMDQARLDKHAPLQAFIAWTGRCDPMATLATSTSS